MKDAVQSAAAMRTKNKINIGWRELVALPELNITCLHAKIDTGARSSAIHAESLEVFREQGVEMVRFETVANDERDEIVQCCLPVSARKTVTNSGGQRELRYFVKTVLVLADRSWRISLSLTTRHQMRFAMLIGREAMGSHVAIYPNRKYLAGSPVL